MPTRYLSALMVRELLELAQATVHKFDIGVEELMIICCVGWNSAKELVEEIYVSREYGYESNVLPTSERIPVSLKTIHNSLNMSRETTRRKLIGLVDRGILVRVPGGYVFPAQLGEHDLTRDLRQIIAKGAARFIHYHDRMREI